MPDQLIAGLSADGQLFPVEKLTAHRHPTRHLAISVFLFSGDQLLIQRRANGKYHSGGRWANTCCSHPAWGEDALDCAVRRLDEELGICAPPLRHTATVDYDADVGGGLREIEQVSIFVGEVDRDSLRLSPNPEEVSAVDSLSLGDLRARIQASPDLFSAWFKLYLNDSLGSLGLSRH